MFENRPSVTKSLAQELYDIAAATGIGMDMMRLHPTLMAAHHDGSRARALHSVALELRIDVRTRETMRLAAQHMRDIADLIEAASNQRFEVLDEQAQGNGNKYMNDRRP